MQFQNAVRRCGLAALFCFVTMPLLAWSPGTHQYVAENAARMMPRSLRAILYTHREALLAGASRPGSEEGSREHHMHGGETPDLQGRILQQVQKVEGLLEAQTPFKEVARELGVLSHFISDANNPLHVMDSDPREGEYIQDYSRYIEGNLSKFPLVFSGYWAPNLESGNVDAFVNKVIVRSGRYYKRIGQDYIRNGKLVRSSVFDEFSFAFGVGALSTSHSVEDTAKIWIYIWKQSGGDMQGLPYGKSSAAAAAASRNPAPAKK